jgi:plastocyanin
VAGVEQLSPQPPTPTPPIHSPSESRWRIGASVQTIPISRQQERYAMTDLQYRTDERVADVDDPISPWHHLTIAGLSTLCAVLISIQVVNATFIPPVAAFAVVVGALAVALARGGGRRTSFAAAATALILVLVNLPVAIDDFRHPETFAGFVPTAAAFIAGIVVVVSGVLAATQRAPRAALPSAVAAVAVIAVCVAISGLASASVTSDRREAHDIVIDVRSVAFPDVTIPAGETGLFVDNHDLIRHTLLIEGTDIDVELPGATARRVTVDLMPGTYQYICDVPGHDAMRGNISVTG